MENPVGVILTEATGLEKHALTELGGLGKIKK